MWAGTVLLYCHYFCSSFDATINADITLPLISINWNFSECIVGCIDKYNTINYFSMSSKTINKKWWCASAILVYLIIKGLKACVRVGISRVCQWCPKAYPSMSCHVGVNVNPVWCVIGEIWVRRSAASALRTTADCLRLQSTASPLHTWLHSSLCVYEVTNGRGKGGVVFSGWVVVVVVEWSARGCTCCGMMKHQYCIGEGTAHCTHNLKPHLNKHHRNKK